MGAIAKGGEVVAAKKKRTTQRKSTRKTIARKSTPVKKHPKRKITSKKKSLPAVRSKKKKAGKRVVKKTTSKKKTTKKVTKKIAKKTSAKKIIKPKTKSKKTKNNKIKRKNTAYKIKSSKEEEQNVQEIKATLDEIRSLELDNKRLEHQISKAQTKQEILSELKTYLALLKQAPSPMPASEEQFKKENPQLTQLQQTLNQNNEQLASEVQKAQTKDKLITRLKNLLAIKSKTNETTQKVSLSPQEKEDNASPPLAQLPKPPALSLQETKADKEEMVKVAVEESEPDHISEINTFQINQIKQEKKPILKESDFKTNKTRGIITPQEAQEFSILLKNATKEINKVFLGQERAVERVLISVVCDAHTLLEGVPGLAKTLLIETLAKIISGTTFKRIQFLPDLLPSDIIGGQVFNPKTAEYKIYKGPIFANFVLCDEINRAPPKTHAAVMEAMQEKKINIENEEFILDRPFFVLATQNPLENKGTYDLPEAVLDRFMFKVLLDYPRREIEHDIITENATTKNVKRKIRKVIDKETLLDMQVKVKTVFIAEKIKSYILDLVEATRGLNKDIEGFKFVKYGAGVRASIYLSLAAKAKAIIEGRNYVLPDDVDFIAPEVLRHRIALNYRGKAHNITPDKIAEEILSKVKAI